MTSTTEPDSGRRPGKPSSGEILTRWNISIPAPLAAVVEEQLRNPLTNKPAYGERSRIVCEALKLWIEDLRARGELRVATIEEPKQ